MTLAPGPVHPGRVPLSFAARGGSARPVRRAARFDGLFPVQTSLEQLDTMLELIVDERGSLDGFDIAMLYVPGVRLEDLEQRGVTWAMWAMLEGEPAADVMELVEAGPQAAHW